MLVQARIADIRCPISDIRKTESTKQTKVLPRKEPEGTGGTPRRIRRYARDDGSWCGLHRESGGEPPHSKGSRENKKPANGVNRRGQTNPKRKKCYPGVTPLVAKEREGPPWRTLPMLGRTNSVEAGERTGRAVLSHALRASPFLLRASPSVLRASDRRTIILGRLG